MLALIISIDKNRHDSLTEKEPFFKTIFMV